MALIDLIGEGRIDNAFNPENNRYSNAFEFNANFGEFPAWEDTYLTMTSHNMDGRGVRTDYNVTKTSGNSIYPLIILIYKGSKDLYFPNYYPMPLQPCIVWQNFNYEWNTDIATEWPWAVRSDRYSTLYNSNDIEFAPLVISNFAANTMFYNNSMTDNSGYVEIDTNIPIIAIDFENVGTWNTDPGNVPYILGQYMTSGDKEQLLSDLAEYIEDNYIFIVNYDRVIPEKKSAEFTIYNTGQKDLWKASGSTYVSGPYYRWANIKLLSTDQTDGRLAFYRQGLNDGKIKLVPVSVASVVACEYSTDGGATWNESSTFPFEYIYGEREDELGEFISATRTGIGGDTGVPLFADETTALKWVNHDPSVDISDALNYEDMTARYGISNKTGIAETTTTMGTASNFKSHFTQKYILDSGEITKISNAFFDTTTNIFEDIKKGLEMMGSSIVDAIGGVKYWPVDLTTVFTRLQSQSYIFFGGYQWPPTGDPTSVTVYKLLGYDGYLSLGTFTIEKSFPGNDYRNYEPYCNVSIYLPYIGMQKLSYNKYVGKTTEVRYYLDINTGGCMACLLCDGKLYDYFNGQMGVDIPITVTDYAGFATAELQNISNLAGVGGNASGALMTGASGNIGGAALATAGAIGAFEKSMYDLQTTSINNFNNTKGGSGAIGNEYLPQYVYLIFEYIKTEETPNLINLAGRASNASGNLGSFSGYLEVDEVELKTSAGMTEAEKNNFISLLHSGIII